MCLLILAKGGATPSKQSLRIAARNNPDGFGFAIITDDNKIHRFRSMDIEETITAFYDARKRYPKSHAIFHLRITTHGATNIDNCHPFQINDDVVMGHNGMLPIKDEDGRSDTRIFAEDWLPELGVKNLLDNPSGVKELEKFIGYSKLAFLNVGDELDKPFYIINERLGHWKHGVWYSNDSYEERVYLPSSYNSGRVWTGYTNWRSPSYDEPTDIQPDLRNYPEDFPHDDEYYDDLRSARVSREDLAFCNERLEWLPISQVQDYDTVEWRCGECGQRTIYDLFEDEPEHCPSCRACYYCSNDEAWCRCWTDDTEGRMLDDDSLFGGL